MTPSASVEAPLAGITSTIQLVGNARGRFSVVGKETELNPTGTRVVAQELAQGSTQASDSAANQLRARWSDELAAQTGQQAGLVDNPLTEFTGASEYTQVSEDAAKAGIRAGLASNSTASSSGSLGPARGVLTSLLRAADKVVLPTSAEGLLPGRVRIPTQATGSSSSPKPGELVQRKADKSEKASSGVDLSPVSGAHGALLALRDEVRGGNGQIAQPLVAPASVQHLPQITPGDFGLATALQNQLPVQSSAGVVSIDKVTARAISPTAEVPIATVGALPEQPIQNRSTGQLSFAHQGVDARVWRAPQQADAVHEKISDALGFADGRNTDRLMRGMESPTNLSSAEVAFPSASPLVGSVQAKLPLATYSTENLTGAVEQQRLRNVQIVAFSQSNGEFDRGDVMSSNAISMPSIGEVVTGQTAREYSPEGSVDLSGNNPSSILPSISNAASAITRPTTSNAVTLMANLDVLPSTSLVQLPDATTASGDPIRAIPHSVTLPETGREQGIAQNSVVPAKTPREVGARDLENILSGTTLRVKQLQPVSALQSIGASVAITLTNANHPSEGSPTIRTTGSEAIAPAVAGQTGSSQGKTQVVEAADPSPAIPVPTASANRQVEQSFAMQADAGATAPSPIEGLLQPQKLAEAVELHSVVIQGQLQSSPTRAAEGKSVDAVQGRSRSVSVPSGLPGSFAAGGVVAGVFGFENGLGLRMASVHGEVSPGHSSAETSVLETGAELARNPFHAMDSADSLGSSALSVNPSGLSLGRGSAIGRSLDVGYQDPSLGYVELHAHLAGSGVHASLVAESSATGAALEGHLGSLAGWMQERHTPVESLTILAHRGEGDLRGDTGSGSSHFEQNMANADNGQSRNEDRAASFFEVSPSARSNSSVSSAVNAVASTSDERLSGVSTAGDFPGSRISLIA